MNDNKMNEEYYISELVEFILDSADEIINDGDVTDIEKGQLLSFYSVLLAIKNDYGPVIGDLSKIGLDFDLEKKFLAFM